MTGIERLSAIENRSTSVVIADQLTERIVDGSFRPGQQINEAQVAQQLKVSRGPVREALQRLAQEGLLISKPNRGVFVRELTPVDIAEIYAAREVIECAAAEVVAARSASDRAATRATLMAIVDRMAPLIERGAWYAVARLDLEFHTTIVTESANTRLSRAYRTLATETLMCIANVRAAYPDPDAIQHDHAEIARLIGEGQMVEIHAILHRHLSMADDYLASAVESELRHGRDPHDVV